MGVRRQVPAVCRTHREADQRVILFRVDGGPLREVDVRFTDVATCRADRQKVELEVAARPGATEGRGRLSEAGIQLFTGGRLRVAGVAMC